MDCRDRRYCKTYFAVDNRLYAFVQFDRPKIENHLLTPESMKKRKSGFTLSGKNLAAENRIFLYVATRFFLSYNEKNGGRKQMKILLTAINAKYIHSNLAVYNLRAYAAHYAKGMADSDTVEIGEYTINNQMEDILEGIYKAKPDVLMFSCYIWNIAFVEELAEEFHKLRPEVPVWVGGPEVSYETESFLREHPQITGVMIGEGEKTFCELAEYYAGESRRDKEKQKIQETQRTGEGKSTEERSKPGEIPGIAYRNGDEIIFTAPREMLDLSDIPFCYDKAGDFKNRIIYYESSRGCPFSCSYCLSSVEKQLRFRDAELVKKELQFFIDREVPQVKFVDRTFNCNHAHAMEIWSYIKEHDNGITNFHFEISADLLREEELALIGTMRPGLIQLEIGVQSTNGATIKEIHRTMQLERLKEVVKEVQKHENIHEHLDLIAGLPFEDYDTFAKSFDEIYELRPNQLQLGFLKVLKGSYMYEHAKEYEIEYHSRPPYEVLKTKWLPYEDVLKIRQVEEMLEVYYNSGQFEITMKVLGVLFKSAFFMFQELGKYYERNGYFGMSHARIRRSEILLEFIKETFAGDITAGEQRNITEAGKKADHLEILLPFRDFLHVTLSQNLISHKPLHSFDIVIHKEKILFLQLIHTLQFPRTICTMLIKSTLLHHSRLIDSTVILHLKICYATFMNCHSITHNKYRTGKRHIQVKSEFFFRKAFIQLIQFMIPFTTRNLYRKVLPILKLIPNPLHQENKMLEASRLALAKLRVCQNHLSIALFTLPFLP